MSPQPPFQLASFDMAGTTVDEDGLVYQVLDDTVTAALGGPVPHDVLQEWKGTSKWEAIQGIFTAVGHDHSDAVVDRHFAVFSDNILAAYRDTPPAPFPGIPETIAALRAEGVKVALQTGYSAPIAAAILAGMGWEVGPGRGSTVDALVTSDLVAASRPAPYLIFHCMEATGVYDVRTVITAGDTPNDVGAGLNAGAGLVLGVLTGSFDRDALVAAGAHRVLPSLADLPATLGR